jgi:PAS domain-containing protein
MARALAAEKKLLLLDALQRSTSAAAAAQAAVRWLAAHAGAKRTVFAAPDHSRGSLTCIAGAGVPQRQLERFCLLLDDPGHPLVGALNGGPAVSPHRSSDSRVALFGGSSFTAVRVTRTPDEPALGLILLSPPTDADIAAVTWTAEALAFSLDRLVASDGWTDGDSRIRREHAVIVKIMNAATDPMMFTNLDGQLLVANTRAEMLFVAQDDVSEGRRHAVQLNNMFLSSALSRKALGESGSERRELLLVDPIDGSDLFFELLSTLVTDGRRSTGVASILRNITDLRQATQQIDENYARLRAAESEVRGERDRLNLLIDSVADPIIVTDPEGEISLMNNPAERLFTVLPGAAEEAQRIVRANDAHFSSFVSGLLSTGWETTRRGEVALVDPNTGKGVPVEALAAKMLSDLGELTAIVTVLHDRTEAMERARLYEELKRASEHLAELNKGISLAKSELNNTKPTTDDSLQLIFNRRSEV